MRAVHIRHRIDQWFLVADKDEEKNQRGTGDIRKEERGREKQGDKQ
jgi:hypothetical protein